MKVGGLYRTLVSLADRHFIKLKFIPAGEVVMYLKDTEAQYGEPGFPEHSYISVLWKDQVYELVYSREDYYEKKWFEEL